MHKMSIWKIKYLGLRNHIQNCPSIQRRHFNPSEILINKRERKVLLSILSSIPWNTFLKRKGYQNKPSFPSLHSWKIQLNQKALLNKITSLDTNQNYWLTLECSIKGKQNIMESQIWFCKNMGMCKVVHCNFIQLFKVNVETMVRATSKVLQASCFAYMMGPPFFFLSPLPLVQSKFALYGLTTLQSRYDGC